ncbi:LOW QUALITY PROTEIN: uncharacterized protein LOC108108880 [Drosophila eugracilis]|uniref:LOW QUALITY PROTEIN: uncharacterized protein LOC108108880 n=1 Tax=Drosophila eugracilis TaxID=29029 RepID=UPI0007E7FDE4|nr:LOW QUALITY PROTEIN: uncharacterized protein LOC108108880 [Drosophila eugracilis]
MDGRPSLSNRPFPPFSQANCVNGKATAAFANFAAAATKAKAQPAISQQILHKCICIYSYIYLSDGRALYCSYVLDGPAKWRSEQKSVKQNQQRSPRRTAGVLSFGKS